MDRPTRLAATVAAAALACGACGGISQRMSSDVASRPSAVTSVPPAQPGAAGRPAGGTVVVEPDQGMATIDQFLESPTTSLDMTMYELSDPTAEQILEADAARGVDVRVLLDEAYHGAEVNQAAFGTLAAHGVHVAWADPSTIFHQKTVTVDNAESCVMTGNLTARYYSTTRDLAVFDTDPADVAAIVAAFDSDFGGAAPVAPPTGSGDLVWSPGATNRLVSLVESAKASIDVESEELDDRAVVDALVAAASRGVDVRVAMEASSSWDSSFRRITAAGGHVATYDNPHGFYVHAKFLVVDSATVWIGSENFSPTSLDYDRELGVVLSAADAARRVAAVFDSDFSGGAVFRG